MTIPETIHRLRLLRADATSGEWSMFDGAKGLSLQTLFDDSDEECWFADFGVANGEEDIAYIAFSHNELLPLLAWMDEARGLLERVADDLEDWPILKEIREALNR